MVTHVLFESASGYALFKIKDYEEIGAKSKAVQESIADLHKFGKMVELLSFAPFKNAADALGNANDISEGDFIFFEIETLLMCIRNTERESPVAAGAEPC